MSKESDIIWTGNKENLIMRTKDDFPKPVIRTLAERAGQRCSNPDCGRSTSGPHSKSNKSIITGEAAHIYAARPGGRRHDPNMTSEQRRDIGNGIWLCSTCAKLIDSDEKKYTPELLKNWKTEHEASISKEQVGFRPVKKESVEAVPKVTAMDLFKGGFIPQRINSILSDLDKAQQKKNNRLSDFLNSFLDKDLAGVPSVWRALIAGFPIIGHDIGSPSLDDLAKLVRELHPYLNKELRGAYHKKVQPILIGILAEVQAFLDDAARAGGIPLAIEGSAPANWRDWFPWLWETGKSYKIDESLLKGRWIYLIPSRVIELYPDIDISGTWAGFIYDIVSRLPDPDKQKGKLLKKLHMLNMIYAWCSTAPQDFRPALTDIVRTPVSSSDHTLAGIYKLWKENSDKSTD